MVARLIGVFTSLKLAVVLLAFSIAVVFFGTLAQTSDGLYLAQKRYFQSWFSTWSPHSAPWLIVPLPGGYLLGTLLLLNLAGAYAKRLQFTAKKTGILLVHVGIVLLLLGQLATDLFARESRMSFAEGEARNFTEAFQDYELAVLTDNSDPSKDDVVAFPQGLVARGGELSHSAIPFRFRVLEWMPNSAVQFRAPMLTNGPAQATEGIGLGFEFLSRPLTGKMDDKNVPTARVEVLGADGKALGTWVVSGYSGDSTMARIEARNWALNFGEELAARLYPRLIAPQTVNVGGKRYQFLLRPERYYEPYSLRLVQTTHEVYPGTDTPKNFQSRVRIENVTTGENREVDIRMNSPLRYKGLTFFQLQMGREELEQGGRGTSVLQVVKNPSWITPYVGCILVGGHDRSVSDSPGWISFASTACGWGGGFGGELRWSVGSMKDEGSDWERFLMKTMAKRNWLPFLGIWVWMWCGTVFGAVPNPFDLDGFGRLPILFNGRMQPLDSLARNSLLQIREKQTVRLADEGREMSAREWAAEVMMNPAKADQRKVFRIDHSDLISLLKLPGKGSDAADDGKHFSWNQIEPGFKEVEDNRKRILRTKQDASQRDAFDRSVLKLHNALTIYLRLKNTIHPQDTVGFVEELNGFVKSLAPGKTAQEHLRSKYQSNMEAARTDPLVRLVGRYYTTVQMEPPLILPPDGDPEWHRVGEKLLEARGGAPLSDSVMRYARMADAFQKGDVSGFNAAVAELSAAFQQRIPEGVTRAGHEFRFNQAQIFYRCLEVYVIIFLMACLYWFQFAEWIRRGALWLTILAFVVHSAGIAYRMYLEGRPPVTNLYSSAVFIGWGAVGLGIILERFWKNAIGLVVASTIGFATLIIAHHLSLGGDTMEVLRAVLDTNFWLATHVVIVTLGYASTYVAGFLAIVYIVRGVLTRGLDAATGRSLNRMVYGIVCFSALFSFVGTVLGGIWADQSWGRFWGWDPKENGALIIVLWNVLILHARWGGMIRERGLMALAIGGNIVTSWSWFGVNMLGIGLHSYGFMDSAFRWLMLFVGSQLLLIGLGLLPLRLWRSFGKGAGMSGAGTSADNNGGGRSSGMGRGKPRPLPA